MEKNACLVANEVVDQFNSEVVNNLKVQSEEILTALHYCDLMMQKEVTSKITFKSYPDEKSHTYRGGIMEVFKTIDKLSSAQRDLICEYNKKIYDLQYRITKLENLLDQSGDSYAQSHDKLMRIIEIINS
jgi:hypothetical protein